MSAHLWGVFSLCIHKNDRCLTPCRVSYTSFPFCPRLEFSLGGNPIDTSFQDSTSFKQKNPVPDKIRNEGSTGLFPPQLLKWFRELKRERFTSGSVKVLDGGIAPDDKGQGSFEALIVLCPHHHIARKLPGFVDPDREVEDHYVARQSAQACKAWQQISHQPVPHVAATQHTDKGHSMIRCTATL